MARTKAPTMNTPLQSFLDVLASADSLANLTDKGIEGLRASVRAALPHIPTIIATGEWPDWTENGPCRAMDAVLATMEPDDEDDPTNEREAVYVVGLLTGLALASALDGSRGTL